MKVDVTFPVSFLSTHDKATFSVFHYSLIYSTSTFEASSVYYSFHQQHWYHIQKQPWQCDQRIVIIVYCDLATVDWYKTLQNHKKMVVKIPKTKILNKIINFFLYQHLKCGWKIIMQVGYGKHNIDFHVPNMQHIIVASLSKLCNSCKSPGYFMKAKIFLQWILIKSKMFIRPRYTVLFLSCLQVLGNLAFFGEKKKG